MGHGYTGVTRRRRERPDRLLLRSVGTPLDGSRRCHQYPDTFWFWDLADYFEEEDLGGAFSPTVLRTSIDGIGTSIGLGLGALSGFLVTHDTSPRYSCPNIARSTIADTLRPTSLRLFWRNSRIVMTAS